MDIASLVGFLLGVVMVVFGIFSSGGIAAFGNFVDIPSVFITIGGSISSVMTSHKMPDLINGFKSISRAMRQSRRSTGSKFGKFILI